MEVAIRGESAFQVGGHGARGDFGGEYVGEYVGELRRREDGVRARRVDGESFERV